MTLLEQIVWGSIYLGICFVLEIILLTWCTQVIRIFALRLENSKRFFTIAAPLCVALVFIVAIHTFQVWLWAVVWILGDILPDWNTALYFSLVTFTTLGYGDIVLGEPLRIFGAFASVTGLLAFGLSTAFMVAVMTQVFKEELMG